MSDKREPSDDFFKSFASQQNGSVPTMTSSSLSSSTNAYPPSYYHKPTTTINATSSGSTNTSTTSTPAAAAAAASNALPSIRSSSSTAPRPTTTTRLASRPTTSARPLPTSAAATTTTHPTTSTTTAPTRMMMNPATSAATNRPNPGYYGGTVPYSSSPSMSGRTVGQTTNSMDPTAVALQGTPTNAAYYSSASVSTSTTTANTTPTAPSPYSNYNYNATTATMTGSSSTMPMDVASAPAAATTTTSHLQNPYLFNNTNLVTPNTDLDAFSGTMDTHATFQGPNTSAPSRPFMFMPQISSSTLDPSNIAIGTSMFSNNNYSTYTNTDFEDDLPLLEELGINAEHIVAKMRSVVLPFSRFKGTMSDATVIQDADLAGPVTLGMLLGGELLLSGKLQFGYVYGFGLFGCISMTLVLNLLSPHDAISIWTVTSILGYSLLPVNLLAALKLLVVDLAKWQLLGQFLAFVTVVWSTVASTRLMEQGCNMRNQRYLIAYPIALLYTAFVMMTIF